MKRLSESCSTSSAFACFLAFALLSACATTPGRDQPLGYVVSSAFSSDGKTIASATSEGEIALFDLTPLRFRALLTEESDKKAASRDYAEIIASVYRPIPLAFSPDGTLLAAASASGKITVWIVATGKKILRSTTNPPITDLIFSFDGQRLFVVGAQVAAWSLGNAISADHLEIPAGSRASAAAISPDGSVLAVGLSTGEIAMFNTSSFKRLRISKEHGAPVSGLAFQKTGKAFASTAGGYDLRVWERNVDNELVNDTPTTDISSASDAFSNAQLAGGLLWLIGTIRGLQIVGAPTLGAPPLSGNAEAVFQQAATTTPFHCGSRVAFSDDGRYVISTANLMKCRDCIGTLAPAFLLFLTDSKTGKTTTLRDLGCEISVSPDSKTFATGGPGAPQIRNLPTGQRVPTD